MTNHDAIYSVDVPYYAVDGVISTPVRVLYTPYQFTEADIADYNAQVMITYPNAILYGDASLSRNCHNFAWNTGYPASYWMNNDSAKVYMADGSYVSTIRSNATHIGFKHNAF